MDHFTDKTPLLNWSHLKFILFSPKGRLNRRRYWLTGLILLPVHIIYWGFTAFMFAQAQTAAGWMLVVAGIVLTIYTSLIISIKRLHDHDRKGHFLWLTFVPMANNWLTIEICFVRGTKGPNRFGEDPLREVTQD
ncbi:MAG: DUF805 domain-containing protein [Candidatus Nucleicultricaceae bacterium]